MIKEDPVISGIGTAIEPGPGLAVGHWIQHRILTIVWDEHGRKHPRFRVAKSVRTPTQEDVKEYVKKVINDQSPDPLIGPTPWDIDLPDFEPLTPENQPRIMVLQLDRKFEWEFTSDRPGIDAKQAFPGEDSGLHYVDPLGMAIQAGPKVGPQAGCRMLYWSVLSRPRDHTGRGFNFYIDLIDPESGRRMPTIFDPNVPDNGSGSIP